MENPISKMTGRERLGVAGFVGILTLIVLGGWTYNRTSPPRSEPSIAQAGLTGGSATVLPEKPAPTPAPTPAPPKELVVYVTGAVKKPGVYRFKDGQRLYQAIEKAGGFQREARKEALNLADTLKDADQIHVPAKEAPRPTDTCSTIERDEPPIIARQLALATRKPVAAGRVVGKPAAPGSPQETEMRPTKLTSASEGVINLNKADTDQLQQLPGIGPAMAERILSYRKEANGFKNIDELQEVRGIGEKTFEKLRALVTI